MARSANAAMMALYRSGMAFSRPWEPPQLVEWERGHFPTRTSGSARAGCGGAAPGGTAAVSGTSACSQGHATGSRTAANAPRLNGCPRRRALAAERPTDAVGRTIRQSKIQTTGQFDSTSFDDGIVGIRAPPAVALRGRCRSATRVSGGRDSRPVARVDLVKPSPPALDQSI
jgi:hypothetical protein